MNKTYQTGATLSKSSSRWDRLQSHYHPYRVPATRSVKRERPSGYPCWSNDSQLKCRVSFVTNSPVGSSQESEPQLAYCRSEPIQTYRSNNNRRARSSAANSGSSVIQQLTFLTAKQTDADGRSGSNSNSSGIVVAPIAGTAADRPQYRRHQRRRRPGAFRIFFRHGRGVRLTTRLANKTPQSTASLKFIVGSSLKSSSVRGSRSNSSSRNNDNSDNAWLKLFCLCSLTGSVERNDTMDSGHKHTS